MQFTPKQVRDFWSKVIVGGLDGGLDECWPWTAAVINSGYGVKRVTLDGKNKMILAHRMAWVIFNSDIPDGLIVCHQCDNKLCCNPSHLFLGTHKDNTQDMMVKLRGNRAQFTPEQALQVKTLRASGMHIRDIAHEMGCSTSPIIRALQGHYDVPEIN